MLVNPKKKKEERELLNSYKEYLKGIIRLKGINPDRCKFVHGYVSHVTDSVVAGGSHPKSFGNELNNWERIPSSEFDKDSWVYLFNDCGSNNRIVINAIKYDRRVVVVRYECPADSD